MKKLFKKIITCAVAAAMLVSVAAPTSVNAAPKNTPDHANDLVVYMDPNEEYILQEFYIYGLSDGDVINAKSVKSSKPAVASKYSFTKTITTEDEESYYYDTESGTNQKYEDINCKLTMKVKKAGTTKISYKINDQTYTNTLTVKKYVNPVKTATFTGINGGKSVAARTNKTNVVNLKLNSFVKNGRFTVTAKAGWKINSMMLIDANTFDVRAYMPIFSPVQVGVFPVVNMKKTGMYAFMVQFVNTNNGGTIECTYYINAQ